MRIALTVAACVTLAACSPEPESPTATSPAPGAAPAPAPATPAAQSNVITAERGGFIPEGVEYDEDNGRFLTGSLAEGTIFVFERDGRIVPFIRDPELVSSVGIEADENRDRLLVANSNSGVFADQSATGHAKLGVYHLTSGERLAMVDLGATIAGSRYFANDVTVDGEGNAYVTDSFANAIYRVTPAYEASVLYRFTNLTQDDLLNGIVHHEGGFLLAVGGARIFKVPLANPAGTTEVAVTDPVGGQDGIVLTDDGRLVATSNSTTEPQLVAFRSNDNWATAQRAGVAELSGPQATTAAIVGDEIWAVHPHFSDAVAPTLERGVFQ